MHPDTPRDDQPAVLRPMRVAAAYLGISRRKLYDLLECDPSFPRPVKYGTRSVGVVRASLDRWLAEQERAGI